MIIVLVIPSIYNYSEQKAQAMRILHTADWHIGQRLHERQRLDEHEQFLDWLLETIQKYEVELLLVSGDIFDTSLPTADATNLYYRFLYRLFQETDAYAVITAGNHDSPRHLEAPQEFLRLGRIYVVGSVTDACQCVFTFPAENPRVAVAAVPYLSESELSHISFESESDKRNRYRKQLKKLYQQCVAHMPPELPKIVMGHLFVQGGKATGSERNIQIGGATATQVSDFPDDVDYVALGHLHRPHSIRGASCAIRYSGSPLPLRFNETHYRKNVYLLNFAAVPTENSPTCQEIEIPIFKELCTVTGDVDSVLREAMTADWDKKYIQVKLRLEKPEVGISDTIREAFSQRGGEVLSVEVELPTLKAVQDIPIEDMQQPTEIFEQFYTEKFGETPDKNVMKTFTELLELAGE